MYRPVIRVEPLGKRNIVTWAEFIESGLLREYRRKLNVPMAQLRAFIDVVRERYGFPYPLAHLQPSVSGRELLSQAQDTSGLAPEFCLVAEVRGQYVLTPPADSFIKRVTWHDDIAAEWRPHDDRQSPVRMNPDVRFGRPAVAGISTEALWEHDQAGESTDEIADEFSLPAEIVRWALAYETSARAEAA